MPQLSARLSRIARAERRRAEEFRDAQEDAERLKEDLERLKGELKTNPALRRKVHQELEIERDLAFQRMKDDEVSRLYGLPSLSQHIAGHKLFLKWREQALLELRQLRQTECLDGDDSWISTMSDKPADTATVLPIITPAAFALQHQQHAPERLPWFRFGAGGTASSVTLRTGKRFSFREMSQKECKPEYYRWLKESMEFRLVKGQSCRDRTTQRFWPRLASLFWADASAASHTGKANDRL